MARTTSRKERDTRPWGGAWLKKHCVWDQHSSHPAERYENPGEETHKWNNTCRRGARAISMSAPCAIWLPLPTRFRTEILRKRADANKQTTPREPNATQKKTESPARPASFSRRGLSLARITEPRTKPREPWEAQGERSPKTETQPRKNAPR